MNQSQTQRIHVSLTAYDALIVACSNPKQNKTTLASQALVLGLKELTRRSKAFEQELESKS